MLDLLIALLKKLGLPAKTIATISVIGALVPAVIYLDDRYAKTEDLNSQVSTLSKQVNDLSGEVGKLAGIQQVLVAVMSTQGGRSSVPAPVAASTNFSALPPTGAGREPASAPAPLEPVEISTAPPKSASEATARLAQVNAELGKTQQRVQIISQKLKQ